MSQAGVVCGESPSKKSEAGAFTGPYAVTGDKV